MSSLPLQPKSDILGEFPVKNMGKIFRIPMSSVGGVHLISGTAHFAYKTFYTSFFYGECTSNLNQACFVRYLKYVKTVLKHLGIMKQIVKQTQSALAF